MKTQLRRRNRRGFTLVELLVVMSIIGILVAMSLPALQVARESARRVTCRNHLKQVGVAANVHLEQHGFFPSAGWSQGWAADPDMGFGRGQPGSWIFSLLPYMEGSNIHSIGLGEKDEDIKKNANGLITTYTLEFMNCPTRRSPVPYEMPDAFNGRNANAPSNRRTARTDYATNGGTMLCFPQGSGNVGALPLSSSTEPQDVLAGRSPVTWATRARYVNGLMTLASECSAAHVAGDGMSQTILAGEKFMRPADYDTGAGAGDTVSMYHGFGIHNTRFGLHPAFAPLELRSMETSERQGYIDHIDSRFGDTGSILTPAKDNPIVPYGEFRFGSAHKGGVNMVFGDGHVDTVNFNVDEYIFFLLCGRDDGEPIDQSKL